MIYFIIAALIVLLDQISKYFLTIRLSDGEAVRLLPGLLRMVYVRNTGAAFSVLSNMRWVLVAVSSVVIMLIIVGLIRYRDKIDRFGKLGLGFILGGAVANLIDRALFGYVADFFEFEFIRFAVFNVADVFITVGGVVFCLWYLFAGFKRDGLREDFIIIGRKKKAAADFIAAENKDGGREAGGAARRDAPEDSGGTDQA